MGDCFEAVRPGCRRQDSTNRFTVRCCGTVSPAACRSGRTILPISRRSVVVAPACWAMPQRGAQTLLESDHGCAHIFAIPRDAAFVVAAHNIGSGAAPPQLVLSHLFHNDILAARRDLRALPRRLVDVGALSTTPHRRSVGPISGHIGIARRAVDRTPCRAPFPCRRTPGGAGFAHCSAPSGTPSEAGKRASFAPPLAARCLACTTGTAVYTVSS